MFRKTILLLILFGISYGQSPDRRSGLFSNNRFGNSMGFFMNAGDDQIEFDGFWSSSLTDSTLHGKPDIEVLDINQRLSNINNIFDVDVKLNTLKHSYTPMYGGKGAYSRDGIYLRKYGMMVTWPIFVHF